MINYWYEITESEQKLMYAAEIFANSDRLHYKIFNSENEAQQWADGYIEGFKRARGESND